MNSGVDTGKVNVPWLGAYPGGCVVLFLCGDSAYRWVRFPQPRSMYQIAKPINSVHVLNRKNIQ